MGKEEFDLNDFRQQVVQMRRLGSVRDLMRRLPGLNQMPVDLDSLDADGAVRRLQGIIDSMTPTERSQPGLIDMSRRRRIAAGAGIDPSNVSGLMKQFDAMAAFVNSMSRRTMFDKIMALTGLSRPGTSG
jgi:signal recognition particle subunit SRP54